MPDPADNKEARKRAKRASDERVIKERQKWQKRELDPADSSDLAEAAPLAEAAGAQIAPVAEASAGDEGGAAERPAEADEGAAAAAAAGDEGGAAEPPAEADEAAAAAAAAAPDPRACAPSEERAGPAVAEPPLDERGGAAAADPAPAAVAPAAAFAPAAEPPPAAPAAPGTAATNAEEPHWTVLLLQASALVQRAKELRDQERAAQTAQAFGVDTELPPRTPAPNGALDGLQSAGKGKGPSATVSFGILRGRPWADVPKEPKGGGQAKESGRARVAWTEGLDGTAVEARDAWREGKRKVHEAVAFLPKKLALQDQLRGSPCSRLFVLGLPGSGKSEVIRWLCDEGVGLFPTCMGWEHEVHFIKTAPMNSMASNIGGRTIHNFSKLGIDLITGVQSGGKKDPELSENMLHTKIQHMRWLIIDEVENVSVELLDAVHRQVKDSTRDKGNPWAVDARVPKQFAMFGGLNLVLLGDLWQIPPVRSLSIAANPFVKRPANVGRILEMFWTQGLPHSVTNRYALTQSHRCSDLWWRSFLAEARAGDLSDRMYDFVHGFSTDVPGSWMPASPGSAEASTGHLGCGKAKCRALCGARQREVSTAFADALFVHPYNAPKSRILTLRAANAAANAGKQLLWVVARDVPLTRDDACRSTESLAHARQNWLMYPENKTGGVPGVLPIFEGMRARFTAAENAEAGACKHSWGTVTGWVLHPDDSKLVKDHRSEPELVLQHVPEAIMVQIPGNTAPRFGNQPAGVFPVKQKEVSWDRSPGFKAMVKRAGFPLVPHFAAAAHCVTGATLPQAIIDLLDARTTPRSSMVPTGYVAISRTRRADDLIITQPFSPMLFRQGHQTGPWLLRSMTAGELTTEQAKAGWAKAEKEAASKSSKKVVDATFQCGDCHQRKRAGNFPGSGMRTSDPVDHAVAVLSQGAWRRCALCVQKQAGKAGIGVQPARSAPFSSRGAGVLECCKCGKQKALVHFRLGEVNDLKARGDLDRAVCIGCAPNRLHFNVQSEVRLFKCAQCAVQKPTEEFDETFFKQHRGAKDLICADCMD
ncbi:unnamed protein product, partial [Prorocentrum cordatum]